MEELLTAKQIQDALKVDRTTIYRMLKDGRLKGVKVGNQWRFPSHEVQEILAGRPAETGERVVISSNLLALKRVQAVIDVFAEMANVGALITDGKGKPIGQMSNCCAFCKLISESPKGHQACQEAWQYLARHVGESPEFITCHAGLQYACAPIRVCNETVALLVTGQFHASRPDPIESAAYTAVLALKYGINPQLLQEAAGQVQVLDQRPLHEMSRWLTQVANVMGQFTMERVDMISRLQQIAEMSAVDFPTI